MSGLVTVVGSANVDVVVPVPRIPGPGETILGGDPVRTPGGKGANQAVAASRAGGAPTAFVAAVGDDDGARLLLDSLVGARVDVSAVERVPAPTGLALISVDPAGENVIVVAPGANGRLRISEAAGALLARTDVLLAQLEVPLESVVESARRRRPGATFVLNAAPSRALPPELLGEVDVLVVNEHEATDLLAAGGGPLMVGPEAAAEALVRLVPAVVVTLGGRGCLVAERGSAVVHVTAPSVDVVDTTGAGDTFCGVLAAGLAAGDSLRTAARAAVVAGALAVTRPGAQPSVPSRAEVLAMAGEEP